MRFLQKIHTAWEKFQAMYCQYFGRNYQCGCGHTTKWKTVLNIYGREGVFKAPSRTPDYCPQCWAKAAIRCAWCGNPILPGDAITLYSPGPPAGFFASSKEPGEAQQQREQKEFVVPDHAVVYRREPRLQLVGCLGWDCADTGADRAGYWVMPGKVQRVMSPLEELVARGSDDPMIFGDLTDPKEATPIPDEGA